MSDNKFFESLEDLRRLKGKHKAADFLENDSWVKKRVCDDFVLHSFSKVGHIVLKMIHFIATNFVTGNAIFRTSPERM